MKIIVKSIAGSHLFGTNTPLSDKDFKGVYLPDAEDILLGKIKKSVNLSTNRSNTKNTSDDIDTEFYSLDKFLTMLAEGQTVAFELLFTPDSHIIEKSEIWDKIISIRKQLVHKKVKAFVGYCQQQANKYGIKGSRMGAIKSVIDRLSKVKHFEHIQSAYALYADLLDGNLIKHTEIQGKDKLFTYLEICGKKYDLVTSVSDLLNSLQKQYDNYGARAKQAELNQGIDWKAISHAIRVCHQAKELLLNGKITLPLNEEHREEVLRVKKGNEDFNKISPRLEELVEEIRAIEKISTLPEELNSDLIDCFIRYEYGKVISNWYNQLQKNYQGISDD